MFNAENPKSVQLMIESYGPCREVKSLWSKKNKITSRTWWTFFMVWFLLYYGLPLIFR